MPLQSLLLCRNQPALRVLGSALDELEIKRQICTAADQAMALLARRRFGALVVDLELDGAAQVLRTARMAHGNRKAVLFAMIGALTNISTAFEMGANFVLYKPLTPEQTVRALRAGKGFMSSERRRNSRQPIETLAYLRQDEGAAYPAIVLDVNQGGFSVQTAQPMQAGREFRFWFWLPSTTILIDGSGSIAWTNSSGNAGIRFTGISSTCARQLKMWLAKRSTKRHSVSVPSQSRAVSRRATA